MRSRDWVLLIDADDTLWYDSRYFSQLYNTLLYCALQDGVPEPTIKSEMQQALSLSSSGENAFAAAISNSVRSLNLGNRSSIIMNEAVSTFLSHPIEKLPGVSIELTKLSRFTKIILTKGNETEQRTKLEHSGLENQFQRVFVLGQKTKDTFCEVLSQIEIIQSKAVMIGNSIKHDILPAVDNGLNAIWLNHSENARGRNADLPTTVPEVSNWHNVTDTVSKIVGQKVS